jgi:DNA (cytosine-5)-methyltransferase 1
LSIFYYFPEFRTKQPTYIDLFAGAGGLSEGFIRSGYKPIAHVEMDRDACLTLKTRLAYHHLKQLNQLDVYISYLKKEISREELYAKVPQRLIDSVINEKISEKTLPPLFATIDDLLGTQTVDLIIGGPPCQAYSTIGRARLSKDIKWDPRKFLYKHYAKFLAKYSPKMFVFENVPGLLSSGKGKYLKDMLHVFANLGYIVEYKKLNASDFGVVQNRIRVIIIGWKKELNLSYPDFKKSDLTKKVHDVLCDLPALSAGESMDNAFYTVPSNKYLSNAGIRNGLSFTTQHIARPHNEQDKKIYGRAITLWNDRQRRLQYTDLPKSLQTHKNKDAFLDRFKVVASDLEASHTLVAHIAKDGHYYIHPDEKQLRSLTVREAARVQSFPDDYYFEGTRTTAFKQIGNAVPPLMANKIAAKIEELI